MAGRSTVRGRYTPLARVVSRIGFGVVSIIAAVLIRVPLEPILEGRNAFIVLEPAIAVAAWYGGFVSGTAATASAVVASLLFYLHPVGSPVIEAPATRSRSSSSRSTAWC